MTIKCARVFALPAVLLLLLVSLTACSGKSSALDSSGAPVSGQTEQSTLVKSGSTNMASDANQTKSSQNVSTPKNEEAANMTTSPYGDVYSSLGDLNNAIDNLDEADETNLDIPNP